ncbi:MAG: WYL domain-containing protein [Acidobacteria bacterium]|nr:WYL domain-containing protein [Acidobacteriota bacterium]
MRKIERLVNLFGLLLETRRPLTVDEIHAKIPAYGGQSDVAFRRMFERDKEELRGMGIPVDRAPTDVWGAEEGYLISKRDALLADPGLTSDERAALWLAARAWGGELGGGNPATALLKLALAGGEEAGEGGRADPGAGEWTLPWVDLSEPNLEPLFDAVGRRKRVEFAYRTGGAGVAEARSVDPYALRFRGGWYLTGFDHLRGEIRRFKVARIEGPVRVTPGRAAEFSPPASAEAAGVPGAAPWEGSPELLARVAFSPESAWWAERRTGAQRVVERDDGWVEMDLPVSDTERFAAWILGFAENAEVIGPAEVRAEVIRRLRVLAEPEPRGGAG